MAAAETAGVASGAAGLLTGGWGQALGAALGGAIAGGPSMAGGGKTGDVDHSGWVVNFGSGDVDATSSTSRETAGEIDAYLPYIIVLAGVLIAWRMTRK